MKKLGIFSRMIKITIPYWFVFFKETVCTWIVYEEDKWDVDIFCFNQVPQPLKKVPHKIIK